MGPAGCFYLPRTLLRDAVRAGVAGTLPKENERTSKVATKRPFMKFFYKDWLTDASLRKCRPATRGIWLDLICRMHDQDTGEIEFALSDLIRSEPRDADDAMDDLVTALEELKRTGTADVARFDDRIVVSCRRMMAEAEQRRKDLERKEYKRRWNAKDYWAKQATSEAPEREPVLRYGTGIRTTFGQNSDNFRTKFGQNSDTPIFDASPDRLPVKSGGKGTSGPLSGPLLQRTDCTGMSDNASRPGFLDGRGEDLDLGNWDANRRAELSARASELAGILGGARCVRPDKPEDRRLVLGVAALVQMRAVNDEEMRTAIRAAETKPKTRRVAYFYGTLRRIIGERDAGPALDEMLNALTVPPLPFPRDAVRA